jgi:hypothetical protein
MKDTPPRAHARACPTAHPAGPDDGPVHTVVLDPAGGRWDLVTLLHLRVTRPRVAVEFARRPTDATAIAEALRGGADAYVVGSGDPEADAAFVLALCDAPPYGPSD